MVDKKSTAISSMLLFSLVLILLYILRIRNDPTITTEWKNFYFALGMLGTFLASVGFVLMFVKGEPLLSKFSHLWSDDDRLLSKKMAVILILILSITSGIFMYVRNTILLPVPEAITQSISPSKEWFITSIVPAFLEDYVFFIVIPSMVYVFLRTLLKNDSTPLLVAVIIISSLAGALLFANFHADVYGNNIPYYTSALVFGMVISMIYLASGIFLPLAHIVHNTIAVFLLKYSIVVGI